MQRQAVHQIVNTTNMQIDIMSPASLVQPVNTHKQYEDTLSFKALSQKITAIVYREESGQLTSSAVTDLYQSVLQRSAYL